MVYLEVFNPYNSWIICRRFKTLCLVNGFKFKCITIFTDLALWPGSVIELICPLVAGILYVVCRPLEGLFRRPVSLPPPPGRPFLKMYCPYIWYVDEAKTHNLQDLKKKLGYVFYILCQYAFSPKKNYFFFISGFGLINFDPQMSEFPMVFYIFVSMFWRAESLGCMWVPFEFESFNNMYVVFSLE